MDHLVFQNDAGTFTVWVNGNQIYNASIGVALQTTTNGTHIGRYYSSGNGAYYYDGYISDVHFIDGLSWKTPTDFATEYNGVWTPIAYSGTYGTGSVRLTFADASDLGNDTSGNNNDYALGHSSNHKKLDANNQYVTTQNSLALRRDVNNYIPSYYNGNTHISYPNAGGNQTFGIGTHEVSRGKWYFEVFVKAENGNINIGIG